MLSRTELLHVVNNYTPLDEEEALSLEKTISFILTHDEPSRRETLDGHVTASSWILSPDKTEALLTHHPKFEKWVQLGGHVEDYDETIVHAALREAREESGITDLRLLSPKIFDIDAHPIPQKQGVPAHWHYDIRFLLQAASTEVQISDESLDLQWRALKELVDADEASIRRMAQKTVHLLTEGSE